MKLRAPTHATVVAYLALFLALGGSAYAATKLPSNSVGTAQIKNSAVTAAKVKANTLTGKQVNESKLAQVPSAKNATMLGGHPASAYLPAGSVRRLDVSESNCVIIASPGCDQIVFNADGFEVEATCSNEDLGAEMIDVPSAPSTAIGGDFSVVSPGTAKADSTFSGTALPWRLVNTSEASMSGVPTGGSWVLRSATHTVTITGFAEFVDNVNATTSCGFYGTAVLS